MSPTGIERRSKQRAGMIEFYITLVYNVMRRSVPTPELQVTTKEQ